MRLRRRQKRLVIISVSIVLIIAIGSAVVLWRLNNPAQNSSQATSQPTFQTLLPSNTSINQLGGWQRVSPPNNDPVFAFVDTIQGISVTVSQQPIPSSFKNNIDTSVAELAKSYNATTELTAGNTKVYIGTSYSGPQSVIFVKNGLLVLIKSEKKIADDDWIKYIQSLN